jgi:hypothetical protein
MPGNANISGTSQEFLAGTKTKINTTGRKSSMKIRIYMLECLNPDTFTIDIWGIYQNRNNAEKAGKEKVKSGYQYKIKSYTTED